MTEPVLTPSSISQIGVKDNPLLPPEQPFSYKGILVNGIHEKSITRRDITNLLDRLPQGYFRAVPLGEIDFKPYKMFSVERDGKVIYTKEDGLKKTDNVIARKRGVTHWNSRMEDDIVVPTDGKMTIKIFLQKIGMIKWILNWIKILLYTL